MNSQTKNYKELLQECKIILNVLNNNNPYFINKEFIEYYNKNRRRLLENDLVRQKLKDWNNSIPKFNKPRIVVFTIIIVIIFRLIYSVVFPDDAILNKRIIPFLLGLPSIYIYLFIHKMVMKPKIKKANKIYKDIQAVISKNIRK